MKHVMSESESIGINRRTLLKGGAALGAVASAAAVGVAPQPTAAQGSGRVLAGASNREPLTVDSPMARWKSPPPLDFVEGATSRFSFPNWQSGNDDSVWYNLNISSFFKSRVVSVPDEYSVLERDIQPDLLDITFDNLDGTKNPTLREYLVGPRQVQAMMMAHKGKVVFEIYPGMNPQDHHVWMSASKTTTGLTVSMLANEGKIDMDQPMSAYVPELAGSAWDNITVKNTMNMSVALDNEETFESLSNPDSWIVKFFTSVFNVGGGGDPLEWRKLLKSAESLPGEKPGDVFRYSTSNTQALVLLVEQVTGMGWEQFFAERVWKKIGARNPYMIGLAPDGTPVGGGLNNTTPEDMLRYAMIYTPSWNVVSDEQIVSDELLGEIWGLGDPAAYNNEKSTEKGYGSDWFGEVPFKNTAQWDHAFEDGAMFKHGNMGQGIYVDPKRDFCGVYFGLATNDTTVAGVDHSPGYLRTAAKLLAGS